MKAAFVLSAIFWTCFYLTGCAVRVETQWFGKTGIAHHDSTNLVRPVKANKNEDY